MERGLLFLPDSKTGRKTIVLNAPALAVLSALPRVGSYVIMGDNPEKSRHDLNRPWKLVSKHAALEGVRLHDLRHTHASFGAAAGLGLPIIGKLLGPSGLGLYSFAYQRSMIVPDYLAMPVTSADLRELDSIRCRSRT